MEQRIQATVLIAILALVVGIVAFAVIYGMNAGQRVVVIAVGVIRVFSYYKPPPAGV